MNMFSRRILEWVAAALLCGSTAAAVAQSAAPASLRPVKAGAVIFNLKAKRIVQMVNSYREITRTGRGRIFDGSEHTGAFFSYRLPEEWALVP